ncbi:MAG: hypothetical protein JNG86_04430, partial [Verrucomicrobiaceae bacterium]|nr:hypothetical protein [Verrucomicrobiaceae bacterium]
MSTSSRPLSVLLLSLLSLLSAFLLFQVQPVISKFILPWFGGSPGVWTTCMLFFQVVLFLGYSYAHALSKLPGKAQFASHATLLLAALLLLPIAPAETWKPQGGEAPGGRILLLLLVSVGLPYFVLSSTSPLVQVWFTRGCAGASPWRLYALSNIGSLAALLSFPFFFEPRWEVMWLTKAWSAAFVAYVALSLAALWLDRRQNHTQAAAEAVSALADDPPPSLIRRALWIVLPALASVVLLAATNHICIDVAVIPFMWVIPLSLYLITFIICFEHERWYARFPLLWALPALPVLFIVCVKKQLQDDDVAWEKIQGWLVENKDWFKYFVSKDYDFKTFKLDPDYIFQLGWAFSAMFLACMVCHGELARLKPSPRRLTSFYLHMSAGGALGGLFVSLIAPRVFVTHAEWPLILMMTFAVCMLIFLIRTWRSSTAGIVISSSVVFGMAIYGSYWLMIGLLEKIVALQEIENVRPIIADISKAIQGMSESTHRWVCSIPAILLSVIFFFFLYLLWSRRSRSLLRSTFVLATVLATFALCYMASLGFKDTEGRLELCRNFFGTLTVTDTGENMRELANGGIIHGTQHLEPSLRTEPTSYYGHDSGIGKALDSLKHVNGARVGVVGMGAGTVACYGKSGDTFRFY